MAISIARPGCCRQQSGMGFARLPSTPTYVTLYQVTKVSTVIRGSWLFCNGYRHGKAAISSQGRLREVATP